MVRQAKVEDIHKRVAICQEYASLWQEFFTTFGTGEFAERRILEQDEARFAKMLTKLATDHFRFCFFMGDKFGDGDKIIDVLERAENLRVLQEMPDANFSKLEIDWHNVFISMHRAVGRLMRELPAEEPEEEAADAKGKKKGKPKPLRPGATRAPSPRPPAAPPRPAAPGPPKLGVPRPPSGPPRPKGP
jgi:hypothetical protein